MPQDFNSPRFKASLDRWITGNYGEDAYAKAWCEGCESRTNEYWTIEGRAYCSECAHYREYVCLECGCEATREADGEFHSRCKQHGAITGDGPELEDR